MNPNVLIVGAGPVGLFTAIEMKLHNPDLQIKILERNASYSRHHILRIEESSLTNSQAYITYEEVRKLKGFIPTSEIETTFLSIAKNLGIEIETGIKVDNCDALLKQYPEVHTLIGADGAHSKVRKQLFGDKKIVDSNLNYIVEIKYKVINKTSALSPLNYAAALGQVPHLVSENIGKKKEGSTPVSLFVFVNAATYHQVRAMPNAKLTDLKPSTPEMYNLLDSIRPWLALREAALGDKLVPNSEKINGVALDIYQSKTFIKLQNSMQIGIVGDAAVGVPYFRALNAGLISATLLAKAFAKKVQNTVEELTRLNQTLGEVAQKEIKRAKKTNQKVEFGIGANLFLQNASKLTTGALLEPEYQAAMLNARVQRPNVLRRNPRIVMTTILFIVTLLIILAIMSALIPFWPAFEVALFGSAAIVAVGIGIFKLGTYIRDKVIEIRTHKESLEAFPLDKEDKKNAFSKLMSSKKPENSQKEPKDVANHPDPLKSNNPPIKENPAASIQATPF